MNKLLIILGSFMFSTLIFIAISCGINLCFIKKIRKISGLKNLIFGLQITLTGMVIFYLVSKFTFHSIFWSLTAYFIPIYVLTTGFTISLIGYLDKSNN